MDIKQKSFAEEDQNGMELKPKTIHRLANGPLDEMEGTICWP